MSTKDGSDNDNKEIILTLEGLDEGDAEMEIYLELDPVCLHSLRIYKEAALPEAHWHCLSCDTQKQQGADTVDFLYSLEDIKNMLDDGRQQYDDEV